MNFILLEDNEEIHGLANKAVLNEMRYTICAL